eukprot:1193390-Lingulodinium_polyedra.AAC.1
MGPTRKTYRFFADGLTQNSEENWRNATSSTSTLKAWTGMTMFESRDTCDQDVHAARGVDDEEATEEAPDLSRPWAGE